MLGIDQIVIEESEFSLEKAQNTVISGNQF